VLRGEQQVGGGRGERLQFQLLVEGGRQREPGMALGPLAAGGIQRLQQSRAEAAAEPGARQPAQLAEASCSRCAPACAGAAPPR
jgi:hypothetical protein